MNKRIDSQRFTGTAKLYSVWFCVFMFFAVIIFFIINGKSLYDIGDGIYQQYTYFAYTGSWIKQLLSNLFIDHIFEIPMWNMSIGMGGDSLIFLSSVVSSCLADPFNWISAIVHYEATEYVFNAVIVLKMYFIGLSFCYFCHTLKLPARSTAAGAMVYTFSAVVYIGFSAAWFFNTFYLFPLLMAGVNRLWEKKGFRFYVLILALCTTNSYYFTFMMGLLVIAYCVIRFITDSEEHSAKKFIDLLIRFAGFSLLGIGIGIGLQIPAILNFTNLNRLSVKWDPEIFSFYALKNYFLYSFSSTDIGHEGYWGVCPAALFALVSLFSRRNRKLIKIVFVIYTAALFLPVAGFIFNGFTFPTGRFVFGYILVVAYIAASEFENIFNFTKKRLFVMLGISVIYLLITIVFSSDIRGLLSGLSLLLFSIGMLCISSVKTGRSDITIGLMLISCILIGIAHLHSFIMGVQIDYGTSYDYMFNSRGLNLMDEAELQELKHSRFDYIPFNIDDVPLNSSMLLDILGYDFYNSNYNGPLDSYYLDMSINSNPMGFMLDGLRGRNYLEIMNGTRYISIQNRGGHLLAPYSYEAVHADADYSVYECSRPVSIIYFYDEAVNSSYIESMTPVETEEIMMNYCITGSGSSTPDNIYQHDLIEFEITNTEGIEFTDGNNFTVESSGIIDLSFDDISNSEISLYIDGIDSNRFYAASASLGYDDTFFAHDLFQGRELTSMYYHWKNTFVINFGFTEGSANTVRLRFVSGDYTLNDIKIYSRSAEQLDATLDAFYGHAGIDKISYEFEGNHVFVNAAADADKYLFFAIPYSDGWSASIDGRDVPVERANIGFMMIPVGKGEHNIELIYRTPYLTAGICISAVSLVIFISVIIVDKRVHGKRHE